MAALPGAKVRELFCCRAALQCFPSGTPRRFAALSP
jgi:hypothetical protein